MMWTITYRSISDRSYYDDSTFEVKGENIQEAMENAFKYIEAKFGARENYKITGIMETDTYSSVDWSCRGC